MPPKKKTKKLQNKSKVKNKASNKTNIKITIDNSRKTQARKPADNKPKGHVNIPVNYFPQFTPARPVITDISPNQGFNTVNFEKVNNEYQTQFKNYFDGKLDDMEKRLLEQSEKKNTAPPRPEMAKPGASHQYTDYDGETVYQEPIRKQPAPQPPQTPQPTNIHGKMIDELKSRLKGITSATPIGKPQNANIAEAEPLNTIQSTNITEAQHLTPKTLIKSMSRIERNEAEKIKKDIDKEETLEDARNTYLKLTTKLGIEPKIYSRASDYSRASSSLADKFHKSKLFQALKSHKDPDTSYINKMNRNIAKTDKEVEVSGKNIRNLRAQTIQDSKTIPQSKRYNLKLSKT